MRRLYLLAGFFVLAPFILVFSLTYYFFLTSRDSKEVLSATFSPQENIAFAALPDTSNEISQEVAEDDGRVGSLRNFFASYGSPLEEHSQFIVSAADKYGLDYRLIPAIAMKESSLCKKIPVDSFNCWGFGIYGSKVTRFSGYEEAIDTVSRGLQNNYINQGLVTPEQIMTKYTPRSDGSWAREVSFTMNQIAPN